MRENDHAQNEPIFFEKKSMRNKQKTMSLVGNRKEMKKKEGNTPLLRLPKIALVLIHHMKGVASQPIECKSRICSTLVGARGRRPL
jgi:hypothetical protein